MHKSYVNVDDCWSKKLPAALNVLVGCKVGNSSLPNKYEYNYGVVQMVKDNLGGFRGGCYNCGKCSHMAWDCSEPSK